MVYRRHVVAFTSTVPTGRFLFQEKTLGILPRVAPLTTCPWWTLPFATYFLPARRGMHCIWSIYRRRPSCLWCYVVFDEGELENMPTWRSVGLALAVIEYFYMRVPAQIVTSLLPPPSLGELSLSTFSVSRICLIHWDAQGFLFEPSFFGTYFGNSGMQFAFVWEPREEDGVVEWHPTI